MKINTILSFSAIFLASVATAAMPDDPNKIDTCTMPGVVALTFDDGPGSYNDALLAILAKKNVKATFFVLGSMIAQDAGQAGALKKVLAAGHQLASHTYSHSNMDLMTVDQMKKEITDTAEIMFLNSGVRPAYMRAPEGRCAGLCTKTMTEMGLVISHWNVDTNDWRFKALSAQEATDKSMVELNKVIIQDSNPATDSFILLQHEIHKFSVDLLADRVIDAILAKGYRFVTMEECVGKPAYLGGSTVPPTTVPVVPSASTAPGAVVPTSAPGGATTSPAAPASTATTASGSGPATSSPTITSNKNIDSAAGIVKAGAWAMGLVAVVGYAMF
ncbi:hypothetical protein BC939DRAFT_451007 [Gamsiella multidivaricata]|uniref:uncharacterized protein n=1 Tax=Gamsiella multidivaricata TaxID=101098 RepID=UPI00221E3BEA|nr:uncharacterized protein BC939DRAFT_451007 [Gamsiella multidivaricata]KAG0366621.1 hypothetical protein BGZ54_005100 [Gamsiella multidivaricata]KAI7823837.1 hypothetical protein BC939DRAFT_451007 [Gamsiella multidivaricata]